MTELIVFRQPSNNAGLMKSRLFDEQNFYRAMSLDLKSARRSVYIESPFITVKRAKEISLIFMKIVRKGISVEIHTRNPTHHDHNLKNQSIRGIAILDKSGVKVTTHDDMRHRKVAIVDNQILWEGSLNMLSHSNSREIMRRSVSVEMCKEMLQCLI